MALLSGQPPRSHSSGIRIGGLVGPPRQPPGSGVWNERVYGAGAGGALIGRPLPGAGRFTLSPANLVKPFPFEAAGPHRG